MRFFERRGAFFQVLVSFVTASFLGCGGSSALENDERGRSIGDGGTSADGTPEIVAPNRFLLFADVGEPAAVTLDLDQQKALALFGTTYSQQIRLLDVESNALLENVLVAIRDACGTSWKNDRPDPGYDCQKTELGRSFGSNWQSSPEFAVVRLLGTTPVNANLKGTSLEDFAALVNQNPNTFRFDFAQVLADSLGIHRTDAVVPVPSILRSAQQHLLGTHPAVMNEQGRLPVSLYDALLNLAPLADKLGPRGKPPYLNGDEHPAVLAPDGPGFHTGCNVLGPAFHMRVVAQWHLRRAEGIKFSSGGGDMFISLGASLLSFDFENPRAFDVQGIADDPTIDMRFVIEEAPAVQACATNPECRPFFLANIVREAAKDAYGARRYQRCHVSFDAGCLVGVDIGKQPAQPGFAVFTNSLRAIKIPSPQFLWDLLTDVAMVELHDPTGDGAADIAPGRARAVFALRGIPIGIRGSELVQRMRPVLQKQEREIAEIIVGKYWEHNDDLDAFVMPGIPTSRPYLFFVAPSDLRPNPENPAVPKAYAYPRPGFFSRSDLSETSRLSRRTIAGVSDTEHEKLELTSGSHVVYARDAAGDTYELTIYVPEGDPTFPLEIAVKIAGRSE